jgi:hypothetical protein
VSQAAGGRRHALPTSVLAPGPAASSGSNSGGPATPAALPPRKDWARGWALDDGFRSRWRAAARASAQASRGRPQQPERSGTSHLRDEHSRGNAWRQFLEASRQQMNSARAWLSRRWLGCKHAVVRPNRGRSSRKQEDTALNAPRDPQAMAFVLARPRRPGDVAFIILRDSMGLRAVRSEPPRRGAKARSWRE